MVMKTDLSHVIVGLLGIAAAPPSPCSVTLLNKTPLVPRLQIPHTLQGRRVHLACEGLYVLNQCLAESGLEFKMRSCQQFSGMPAAFIAARHIWRLGGSIGRAHCCESIGAAHSWVRTPSWA